MKTLLFCLILLPALCFGQKQDSVSNTKAQFKGGHLALRKFIQDSLRYPESLKDSGFQGSIIVKFTVRANGRITDLIITGSQIYSYRSSRKPSPAEAKFFYDEAYRLVRSMPNWVPAKKQAVPYESSSSLHIEFWPPGPAGARGTHEVSGDNDRPPRNPSGEGELEPFLYVEQMPQFPGGDTAMRGFISRTIKYPPFALENQIEGTVYVKFIVRKNGSIENATVVKSIPALDQEALRVIRAMPLWKPGKQNGRPVHVYVTVPIKFRIL